MVCVDKNLEAMLSEIGNARQVVSDVVVPFNYFSKDFAGLLQEHGEFYWLRQYETQLSDSLQRLNLPVEFNFDPLIDSPVRSALENAYVHSEGTGGKTGNMKSPIKVQVFLGEKGIVFTVQDSGKGFDFNSVVEKKRNREKYFNACRGDGFQVFDVQMDRTGKVPYEVSGEGNRINVLYRFEGTHSS